mmetsp:Transcript_117913/g.165764  ORF Transcript_117913/g.165764 Transcript_117913/m.165764 type:complete len:84 (-) Transcript_117913:33-284(-)
MFTPEQQYQGHNSFDSLDLNAIDNNATPLFDDFNFYVKPIENGNVSSNDNNNNIPQDNNEFMMDMMSSEHDFSNQAQPQEYSP